MRSTGEILNDTIRKLGLDSKIKSHHIWYIWDKVVGHHIANVAQPEDVKGKTLFVNVRDNIWLRQLKFLESMITDKLNNTIGETVINKIYFKLGEIKQSTVTSQQSPVLMIHESRVTTFAGNASRSRTPAVNGPSRCAILFA